MAHWISINNYTRNTYNGTLMNHKFAKNIFVDNRNALSTTLTINFELEKV